MTAPTTPTSTALTTPRTPLPPHPPPPTTLPVTTRLQSRLTHLKHRERLLRAHLTNPPTPSHAPALSRELQHNLTYQARTHEILHATLNPKEHIIVGLRRQIDGLLRTEAALEGILAAGVAGADEEGKEGEDGEEGEKGGDGDMEDKEGDKKKGEEKMKADLKHCREWREWLQNWEREVVSRAPAPAAPPHPEIPVSPPRRQRTNMVVGRAGPTSPRKMVTRSMGCNSPS